jgi:hypothetical protein
MQSMESLGYLNISYEAFTSNLDYFSTFAGVYDSALNIRLYTLKNNSIIKLKLS